MFDYVYIYQCESCDKTIIIYKFDYDASEWEVEKRSKLICPYCGENTKRNDIIWSNDLYTD